MDGYNPDGSDWYWAQYLEDGTIQTAGSPDMCTGVIHLVKTMFDLPVNDTA